ncbi:hypothetical protein [Nocardia sp. NPDC051832]|uniref:hypothetical protein n=1 Tax=Nocardia sp. NPDC051832 TaxID=3155673 RepID=UPI00342E4F09
MQALHTDLRRAGATRLIVGSRLSVPAIGDHVVQVRAEASTGDSVHGHATERVTAAGVVSAWAAIRMTDFEVAVR